MCGGGLSLDPVVSGHTSVVPAPQPAPRRPWGLGVSAPSTATLRDVVPASVILSSAFAFVGVCHTRVARPFRPRTQFPVRRLVSPDSPVTDPHPPFSYPGLSETFIFGGWSSVGPPPSARLDSPKSSATPLGDPPLGPQVHFLSSPSRVPTVGLYTHLPTYNRRYE